MFLKLPKRRLNPEFRNALQTGNKQHGKNRLVDLIPKSFISIYIVAFCSTTENACHDTSRK